MVEVEVLIHLDVLRPMSRDAEAAPAKHASVTRIPSAATIVGTPPAPVSVNRAEVVEANP